MTILRDVLKELWSMFVADARLTLALLALLALVALVGAVAHLSGTATTFAPILLVVGVVTILIGAVVLAARRR